MQIMNKWGDEVEYPAEMLRRGDSGWLVRCWCWQGLAYSRSHGCCMPAVGHAPDYKETREAHPEGWEAWLPVEEAFRLL